MKYCESCNQNVLPTKKFSLGWCILGVGVFYMIYFLLFKKKTCPICNGGHLEDKRDNILNNNSLPTMSRTDQIIKNIDDNKIKAKEAHLKSSEQLENAQVEFATAKEKTAETIRKRKAGELPWQIKAAEKKAAKLNKII